MQSTKTWKSSIEFKWDEIPIEQRNGIIRSYKIFYWNKKGPVNGKFDTALRCNTELSLNVFLCLTGTFSSVVTANLQERRLVLENLDSELVYEAFMMVSTYGGSLNGSRIYFQVDPYGWYYIIRSEPMTPSMSVYYSLEKLCDSESFSVFRCCYCD